MKKLFLLIVILLFTANLDAQIRVYKTNHLNIGFGKASNCSTNQFMQFCVNGPLLDINGLPVGGYVDNGIQKQKWTVPSNAGGNFSLDNAIFGLDTSGNLFMIPVSDTVKIPGAQWAFQNGPILVSNGKNVRGTSSTLYPRSGIGFTPNGTVVVIVSLTPITFRDFSDLFVRKNCVNAIYLDGNGYVGCSDDQGSYGSLVTEATKLQFFNN